MADLEDTCHMVTTLLGPRAQEHFERAGRLKGQDPNESMKRTRQQLVDEFAESVGLNA